MYTFIGAQSPPRVLGELLLHIGVILTWLLFSKLVFISAARHPYCTQAM